MQAKFIAAIAAICTVVGASAQTIVLSNSGLPGDSFSNPGTFNTGQAVGTSGWYYNNVRNQGIVGVNTQYARSGNGSLYFETVVGPSGSSSKADAEFFNTPSRSFLGNYGLGANSVALGRLSDLTSLSYEWYRDSASTNSSIQHPALRLLIANATGSQIGYIVFERAYNGGVVPTDQWVADDIFANRTSYNMWSTGSLPGAGVDFTTTLDQWMLSGQNYSVFGVSTGVGSGWGPFRGAVDNVGFGFNGQNRTYNFEAVPEPASMTALGLGVAAMLRRKRKR